MSKTTWSSVRDTPSGMLANPNSLLAILGLTLVSIGRETIRYPIIEQSTLSQLTYTVGGHLLLPVHQVILVLGLLLLVLLCCRCTSTKKIFAAVPLFLASALMGGGILVLAFDPSLVQENAGAYALVSVNHLLGFYLFAAWAALLYRQLGRRSIILLIVSFLLSGLFQALVGLLQLNVALVLCAVAPAASTGILVYLTCPGVLEQSEVNNGDTVMRSLLPETPLAAYAFVAVIFCCYGVLCFSLHASWIGVAEVTQNLLPYQTVGAVGVLALALALTALITSRHSMGETDACYLLEVLLFALLTIAVCFTLAAKSYRWMLATIPILDASHKLVIAVAWLIPLYFSFKKRPIAMFIWALAAYQIGAFLASAFGSVFSGNDLLLVTSLVIPAVGLVYSYMRMNASAPLAAETQPVGSEDEEGRVGAYEDMLFRVFIADEFGLTKREAVVAILLEQGMTLSDIARELVISQETAKTHRRNVLRKLEASSQAEVAAKLDEKRAEPFRDFVQHVVQLGDKGAA